MGEGGAIRFRFLVFVRSAPQKRAFNPAILTLTHCGVALFALHSRSGECAAFVCRPTMSKSQHQMGSAKARGKGVRHRPRRREAVAFMKMNGKWFTQRRGVVPARSGSAQRPFMLFWGSTCGGGGRGKTWLGHCSDNTWHCRRWNRQCLTAMHENAWTDRRSHGRDA